MTTKEIIINKVKQWISYDDKIKFIQKEMKQLKLEKKQLTDSLLDIMKSNEVDCFDINDNKIMFCKSKVKVPLNKKILLENLEKYFENNPQIDAGEVGEFVLENRDIKIKENIKRK